VAVVQTATQEANMADLLFSGASAQATPSTFGALTMTSQQIADLVESRHDHVKRSIDRLVNQGVIVQPPMGDEPGTDAMGRSRPTQVYLFTGAHGKLRQKL
jgi:phage regulator Rha-like protein